MPTVVQENPDTPGSVTHVSDEPPRDFDVEASEKTDRQLHFPARVMEGSIKQARSSNPARTRWLKENDVHTQFLDAGVGCCWFAQQGDQEPVSGETEDEAVARLARENGLELWRDA
jgi:hypothetical protein